MISIKNRIRQMEKRQSAESVKSILWVGDMSGESADQLLQQHCRDKCVSVEEVLCIHWAQA